MSAEEQEGRNDGESDWEDQDLLTTDLATERIDEEITALRALIAATERGDDADADALPGRRARVAVLLAARERLSRQRNNT